VKIPRSFVSDPKILAAAKPSNKSMHAQPIIVTTTGRESREV
jgi:hypothetical protein